MHLLPRKRDRLLTQPVGDETIVYDEVIRKAFCLSAEAAAIWNKCDGSSTLEDATRAVTRVTGLPVAAETALLTLDAFACAGLLDAAYRNQAPAAPDLSRRRALSTLAGGAALLVPAIFAVMTPLPAEAYTCTIGLGGVCVVKGTTRQANGSPAPQHYVRHSRSRDSD